MNTHPFALSDDDDKKDPYGIIAVPFMQRGLGPAQLYSD
jgi:hypothetical protein